jgi:hypothetical protein
MYPGRALFPDRRLGPGRRRRLFPYESLNDLINLSWDNTRYASLKAFSTATGQEKNGLNVDPGFFDPAHENYALDPASDLVDSGILIPGINDDYSGHAPDLGAFEYNTGNSAPVAVNHTVTTEADTPATIDTLISRII